MGCFLSLLNHLHILHIRVSRHYNNRAVNNFNVQDVLSLSWACLIQPVWHHLVWRVRTQLWPFKSADVTTLSSITWVTIICSNNWIELEFISLISWRPRPLLKFEHKINISKIAETFKNTTNSYKCTVKIGIENMNDKISNRFQTFVFFWILIEHD